MTYGEIVMRLKDKDRLTVLEQVSAGLIRQKRGAEILELSSRQMIRVMKAFRRDGAISVVSKKQGKASNRRLSDTVRTAALEMIKERCHLKATRPLKVVCFIRPWISDYYSP